MKMLYTFHGLIVEIFNLRHSHVHDSDVLLRAHVRGGRKLDYRFEQEN